MCPCSQLIQEYCLDTVIIWGQDSSVGKESACSAGDPVLFLGWEDLLEKG